jgi:hypothetical protein
LPEDERMSTIALKGHIAFDVLWTGRENEIEYEVANDPRGDEYRKAKKIVLDPKNSIKHMNVGEDDRTVSIDLVATARRWIDYALINFDKLLENEAYRQLLQKSPTMQKYQRGLWGR